MKISVSWLKDFITIKPPLEGTAERLTLAGLEVKTVKPSQDHKDTVFEIEITSNRPDWLSHLGVAREIAAVENQGVKMPELDTADPRQAPAGWKIHLRELKACPYYSGVLIEGIEMNPTPDFMRERLEACGFRSINLIVDITNYVLIEMGQPLHAFDADLLKGKEIHIRFARPKESLLAIDGRALELDSRDIVIADHHSAVALAGVMGGKETEVGMRTRNIFLESALFDPRCVRQSSRRHALQSESSYRFERRVDPEGADKARQRALYLIRKYAKPRSVFSVIKAGDVPRTSGARLAVSAPEIRRVLGAEIKPHTVHSILTRLGLEPKALSAESWEIRVPSWRADLLDSVDLIEEIARIYGYDQIPEILPVRAPVPYEPNPILKTEDCLRTFLCGAGLFETITFSLIKNTGLNERDLKNTVRITNPMHQDLRWMRPTLLTSFLNVVKKNLDAGSRRIPIFETAQVYSASASDKAVQEHRVAGLALAGQFRRKSWMDEERNVTFFDLKGIVESLCDHLGVRDIQFRPSDHPMMECGSAMTLTAEERSLGVLGRISSETAALWDIDIPVFAAELSLVALAESVIPVRKYQPLPRFPATERDLAVVVPERIHAGEIRDEVMKLAGGLAKRVDVFDVFRGGRIPQGSKNIALRVLYQSMEKTLLSEDVQKLHAEIAEQVSRKFSATFQS